MYGPLGFQFFQDPNWCCCRCQQTVRKWQTVAATKNPLRTTLVLYVAPKVVFLASVSCSLPRFARFALVYLLISDPFPLPFGNNSACSVWFESLVIGLVHHQYHFKPWNSAKKILRCKAGNITIPKSWGFSHLPKVTPPHDRWLRFALAEGWGKIKIKI